VDVNRNYFLVFGGANKRPMMAEARQQLSIKYAGFVPFQFVNLSVDEAKSNYFFLYTQHRLTITANMLFENPEYVDMAKEAIADLQDFGLVKGDRVMFRYNYRATDKNTGIYGQGVITELANYKVFIQLDSATRSNPKLRDYQGMVPLQDVELLPKHLTDYKEGDRVKFKPRGYDGEPFMGSVKAFYSSYVAAIKLSEADEKRWNELGGKVEVDGSIYVPTFRLFK
jgi:hypothetical protein